MLLKHLNYKVQRLHDVEVDAARLKHSLLNHLDVQQVIHQAEQKLELTNDYVNESNSRLVRVQSEQVFEEHDRSRQRGAELVRDGRGVRFDIFGAIALLEDLGLELHCIDMVCHAAEVDSGALGTLVGDLLDVNGAELVLEALRLAGWQLATGSDHVDANYISCSIYNIDDAHVVPFLVSACQQIALLIISPARQSLHRDINRQKVRLLKQARVNILLHFAPSKDILTIAHDPYRGL